MPSERLGVITFFGIIIPGVYLTVVTMVASFGLMKLYTPGSYSEWNSLVAENALLTTGAILVVSYLIGVALRLFAPKKVDKLSTFFLRFIRREKGYWAEETFPYFQSLKNHLERMGMSAVPEYIERLNPKCGTSENLAFFNYCKCFIASHDPVLSRQIRQAEAFVRFLSGTAIGLLATILMAIGMIVVFAGNDEPQIYSLYIALLGISVVLLFIILQHFKYQRRSEVTLVWSSVYLVIHRLSNESEHVSISDLEAALFFGSEAKTQKKNGSSRNVKKKSVGARKATRKKPSRKKPASRPPSSQ